MADFISLIILALIIGVFIAIVVVSAQFTINNIGTLIVLAIIGFFIYLLYQLLKPIENPKTAVKPSVKQVPQKTKPVKQYQMPKALKTALGWGTWLIISYIITELFLVIIGVFEHSHGQFSWAIYVYPAIPFLVTAAFYIINRLLTKTSKSKKRTSNKS